MQNSIESLLHPTPGGCAVLCLVSVALAIPGVRLGLTKKLIIYDGKDDLIFSWIVIVVSVVALISLAYPWWGGAVLLLASFILFAVSCWRTYRANQSIWKSLLAVPTKFAVLGLMVLCAILSFSIAAGLSSFAQKKHKEGARELAVGAAGLAGFYLLKKLIEKLVRRNQSHE